MDAKTIKLCYILFFIFTWLISKTSFGFTPIQLDISGKVGNKRHIAYSEVMVPILFNEQNILFSNIRGMVDSIDSKEINVGLGYRFIYPQYILGTYVFFDYRTTKYRQDFSQITFGGELLLDKIDARVNFYLPSDKKPVIGKSINTTVAQAGRHTIIVNTAHNDLIVSALSGFDCEIGTKIPSLEFISTHLAYYHFSGKNVPSIDGIRNRTSVQVLKWLYIDGEVNYDNTRKTSFYIGARISLQFGEKKPVMSKSPMHERALTPPIRDIDIRIAESSITTKVIKASFV